MTRTGIAWRIAAAVFVFINVAGFGYAVAMEEMPHAAVHVALLVAGIAVWQLARWGRRKNPVPSAQLNDPRIEYLQQSVDAVALEVERLGEAQRFAEKLRAERGEISPKKDA